MWGVWPAPGDAPGGVGDVKWGACVTPKKDIHMVRATPHAYVVGFALESRVQRNNRFEIAPS